MTGRPDGVRSPGDARGERVGAPAELAPGQRAELVDQPDAVGSAGGGQAEAGGRGDAVPADDQAHPDVLVRAQRRDQAGAREGAGAPAGVRQRSALRSPLLMSADPLSR